MLVRIYSFVICLISVVTYFSFRYIDGMRSTHDVAVSNALGTLTSQTADRLASTFRSQRQAGESLALPAATSEPLCAPGVSPCNIVAQIGYTIAGSTTGGVSASTTATAYNLAGALNEARFYVNVDVKMYDTETSCGTPGCLVGERLTPYAFRTSDATPYVSYEPALPNTQNSQTGTSISPADYGGCDASSGCGTLPNNGATPDPRILLSNPNCVNSSYGGCAVSTPPPANLHDVTYPNADVHS